MDITTLAQALSTDPKKTLLESELRDMSADELIALIQQKDVPAEKLASDLSPQEKVQLADRWGRDLAQKTAARSVEETFTPQERKDMAADVSDQKKDRARVVAGLTTGGAVAGGYSYGSAKRVFKKHTISSKKKLVAQLRAGGPRGTGAKNIRKILVGTHVGNALIGAGAGALTAKGVNAVLKHRKNKQKVKVAGILGTAMGAAKAGAGMLAKNPNAARAAVGGAFGAVGGAAGAKPGNRMGGALKGGVAGAAAGYAAKPATDFLAKRIAKMGGGVARAGMMNKTLPAAKALPAAGGATTRMA